MLRTGACVVVTGPSISSILLTGAWIVGPEEEVVGSSSISSMLRTGDRGAAVYGDDERILVGEEAAFKFLFSKSASTSCLSMSSMASMLIGRWFDILAVVLGEMVLFMMNGRNGMTYGL